MSKVIIGIHGLGNKPPKDLLEEWWLVSMREGLKSIGKYVFPAKFELVYWADILYDKPLDPSCVESSNPRYLEERYTPSPINYKPKQHKIKQKVLDIIEKQMDKILLNERHSVAYDHITEIIISKYFHDLEIYYSTPPHDKRKLSGQVSGDSSGVSAKERIRNRIDSVLRKYRRHDILLIGHSMGSIIAYDVLSLMKPEVNVNTFVTIGSPLGLPVVMKKIADELGAKINNSIKLKTPESVMRNWYNFSDLEDKVAINYNLSDDYEANSLGVNAIDTIVNNNYSINDVSNPHKAYGYLRTPEFSKVLYEFFTYDKSRTTNWLLSSYNKLVNRFGKIF